MGAGKRFEEFVEEEKTGYFIEYETDENGDFVKKIVMGYRHLPLWPEAGNHVERNITVEVGTKECLYHVVDYVKRDSWYGTGTDYVHELCFSYADQHGGMPPMWFEDPADLEESINTDGVKKTIQNIIAGINETVAVKGIEEE